MSRCSNIINAFFFLLLLVFSFEFYFGFLVSLYVFFDDYFSFLVFSPHISSICFSHYRHTNTHTLISIHIKLHVPEIIKKHTHTRTVFKHHFVRPKYASAKSISSLRAEPSNKSTRKAPPSVRPLSKPTKNSTPPPRPSSEFIGFDSNNIVPKKIKFPKKKNPFKLLEIMAEAQAEGHTLNPNKLYANEDFFDHETLDLDHHPKFLHSDKQPHFGSSHDAPRFSSSSSQVESGQAIRLTGSESNRLPSLENPRYTSSDSRYTSLESPRFTGSLLSGDGTRFAGSLSSESSRFSSPEKITFTESPRFASLESGRYTLTESPRYSSLESSRLNDGTRFADSVRFTGSSSSTRYGDSLKLSDSLRFGDSNRFTDSSRFTDSLRLSDSSRFPESSRFTSPDASRYSPHDSYHTEIDFDRKTGNKKDSVRISSAERHTTHPTTAPSFVPSYGFTPPTVSKPSPTYDWSAGSSVGSGIGVATTTTKKKHKKLFSALVDDIADETEFVAVKPKKVRNKTRTTSVTIDPIDQVEDILKITTRRPVSLSNYTKYKNKFNVMSGLNTSI